MSYFPPPLPIEDAKIINYSKAAVTNIPLNTLIGNAIEVIKFQIVKDVGTTDQRLLSLFLTLQGVGERLTGSGFSGVFLAFDTSADGVTWTSSTRITFNTAGFIGNAIYKDGANLVFTDQYARVALYCNTPDMSGNIKQIKIILKISIPLNYSFVRLI